MEKCFLVLVFLKMCFFFLLYYAGEGHILQFYIIISGFIRTSLINLIEIGFPHDLPLLLRGQ